MIEKLNKIVDEYRDEVDFIEAINIDSSSTPISVKANKLNSIESNYTNGIGIRVIKDSKVGFSFSNKIEDYKKITESAIQSSAFGDEIDFNYPKNEELEDNKEALNIYSKETEEISVDSMKSTLSDLITDIESIEKLNIDAEISKAVSNISIVNSLGRGGSYKKSSLSLSAYGVKVDDNGLLWVGGYQSRINIKDIDKDKIISDFKEQLNGSEVISNPSATTKKIPIIFTPSAFGFMLETFMLGINGKNHYKKTSPLIDKIGEKIIGDNITIIEDPLSNTLTGSAVFDRELIPTQKKYIFENGIYRSVITDVKTANQLNIKPSGNAVGGYSSIPGIGIRNITMLHGETPLEKMINEDDETILVYSVLGGGQSNMLAGDFSVNIALGFHIKGGKILGRVKNVMLSGNVYDVFKECELSKEHVLNGAKDLPYIKFNNLNVSV